MSKSAEQIAENLYRITEIRTWVRTNVLFPEVSDTIVDPACDGLRKIEDALIGVLYRMGEVHRAVAIEKQLKPAPRTPVI